MSIHQAIADAMPKLSHLECDTCHRRRDVGDVAFHFRHGWPVCCGYGMRLVTQAEVDDP